MAEAPNHPIVHEFPLCEVRTIESRPARRHPLSSFGGSDDAQSYLRMAKQRRDRQKGER